MKKIQNHPIKRLWEDVFYALKKNSTLHDRNWFRRKNSENIMEQSHLRHLVSILREKFQNPIHCLANRKIYTYRIYLPKSIKQLRKDHFEILWIHYCCVLINYSWNITKNDSKKRKIFRRKFHKNTNSSLINDNSAITLIVMLNNEINGMPYVSTWQRLMPPRWVFATKYICTVQWPLFHHGVIWWTFLFFVKQSRYIENQYVVQVQNIFIDLFNPLLFL